MTCALKCLDQVELRCDVTLGRLDTFYAGEGGFAGMQGELIHRKWGKDLSFVFDAD